ncbi:hypothetical protein ABZX93_28935 [Streptomyces sp. NPDC006632]|uniref:hypothetical protein n=1 Tax=Streptomyces sp. NPDC006632 TaxID=3157182 RepID=UPI0033B89482
MRGEASDDGRVYQARRDQRIEQRDYTLNVFLDRGADAETYRGEADRIVTVLLHAVGSLEERCEALERKSVRARAAGRAEAYAEIQAELQASGLKLRRVQGKLKEAQQDREVAERLLTEARRAAEEYRREAEELRRRQAAPEPPDEPVRETGPTLGDYDRFIDTADAELAALRTSLERLGDEMSLRADGGEGGGRMVAGEVVDPGGAAGEPPAGPLPPAPASPSAPGPASSSVPASAGEETPGHPVSQGDPAEAEDRFRDEEMRDPRSTLPGPAAHTAPLPVHDAEGSDAVGSDTLDAAAPAASDAPPAEAGHIGLRMTTLGFLVSMAPPLLVGASIREVYGGPHGPAVLWGLAYVLVSLVVGYFLGFFLKTMVLVVGGWDGDHDFSTKMTVYTTLACLVLIYGLCLPASLGPWVSTPARFLAQWLGPA